MEYFLGNSFNLETSEQRMFRRVHHKFLNVVSYGFLNKLDMVKGGIHLRHTRDINIVLLSSLF